MNIQNEGVPWSSSPDRNTARAVRVIGRRRARVCSGVKAVIAQSFERIHRPHSSAWAICRCVQGKHPPDPRPRRHRAIRCRWPAAHSSRSRRSRSDQADERQDGRRGGQVPHRTPIEIRLHQHGGILPYVLRQLVAKPSRAFHKRTQTLPAARSLPATVARAALLPSALLRSRGVMGVAVAPPEPGN